MNAMNSEGNLKRRILKMYPVKLLKDTFNVTGSQDVIVNEIATSSNSTAINNFAINNLNNTKQHVYIYNYTRAFNERNFDPSEFPLRVISHNRDNQGYQIRCIPQVQCTGTLRNTVDGGYRDVMMIFPQPINITVSPTHIIIRATIIEKDIAAYMTGGNVEAFNVKKDVDDDFTSQIIGYFRAKRHSVEECDINPGVKHLCDNNILDLKSLRVMKNRSTATEVMNGTNTFKLSYPTEYAGVMLNPLGKSSFRYMLDDDNLCRIFAADPNIGRLSISLFPTNSNQVNNVITQILTNN